MKMALSRSHQGDHTALVETLYEAALQPDLLPQALHAYARAFDASIGLTLNLGDVGGQVIVSADGRDGRKPMRTDGGSLISRHSVAVNDKSVVS